MCFIFPFSSALKASFPWLLKFVPANRHFANSCSQLRIFFEFGANISDRKNPPLTARSRNATKFHQINGHIFVSMPQFRQPFSFALQISFSQMTPGVEIAPSGGCLHCQIVDIQRTPTICLANPNCPNPRWVPVVPAGGQPAPPPPLVRRAQCACSNSLRRARTPTPATPRARRRCTWRPGPAPAGWWPGRPCGPAGAGDLTGMVLEGMRGWAMPSGGTGQVGCGGRSGRGCPAVTSVAGCGGDRGVWHRSLN